MPGLVVVSFGKGSWNRLGDRVLDGEAVVEAGGDCPEIGSGRNGLVEWLIGVGAIGGGKRIMTRCNAFVRDQDLLWELVRWEPGVRVVIELGNLENSMNKGEGPASGWRVVVERVADVVGKGALRVVREGIEGWEISTFLGVDEEEVGEEGEGQNGIGRLGEQEREDCRWLAHEWGVFELEECEE